VYSKIFLLLIHLHKKKKKKKKKDSLLIKTNIRKIWHSSWRCTSGCPLSPILFNLFISDFFLDKCDKFGISIGNKKKGKKMLWKSI